MKCLSCWVLHWGRVLTSTSDPGLLQEPDSSCRWGWSKISLSHPPHTHTQLGWITRKWGREKGPQLHKVLFWKCPTTLFPRVNAWNVFWGSCKNEARGIFHTSFSFILGDIKYLVTLWGKWRHWFRVMWPPSCLVPLCLCYIKPWRVQKGVFYACGRTWGKHVSGPSE